MDPVTGGIAAAFAILSILLFLKVMGQAGTLSKLKGDLESTQRDLKKTSQQLNSKKEKYDKKAQQASKNQSASKDQKSRIAGLQDELHASKAELGKAKDKVKSFSSEVNRLRIEREELRQALTTAKNRSNTAPAESFIEAPVSTEGGENDAPAAMPPRREAAKAAVGRLERDIERAEKDLERQIETNKRMKRNLVETTARYRAVSRKNEHNRRAYVITQLQLDLLQDENYTLKHGSPPPHAQADKAAKRKALLPQEAELVIDKDAEPIQLPSPEELDAAELAPSAAIIERAADRVPEPEPEPEIEDEDLEAAEAEHEADLEAAAAEIEAAEAEIEAAEAEAEAAAAAEAAEPEAEGEVVVVASETRDKSVKRRRKVKTEEVDAPVVSSPPPRPTS